ncbi:5'-phosphate synthase pdxT subunit [Candidatus Hakubella thermalkaliphila]|uniref:Pyridoxal 5'-phosphate synthase subunit PdxT n=1 Tax=Candidatus Hakubella thermalkaliphila TaxID=2754717 RepID=A0A6V8Q1I7_9ACTN|nr:pyridoxal 5'-phosphate synthase glutaminase subunit PdxT [Candidatus Hakubella thermalkaliphila]GFP19369.1 5'-phosphate synthase pdxT subunit [Candidatus Hakubella thermalkaliphila]GFP30807.1 5'-phosphate synthase pdxT subunit [Candidatus Hakubella thermalkaliphila]GFP37256.1 5'-phosphate synthase pdxT subunit [Candidatus Hakubella thermalkaliphila]GFP40166.1 5'-phosphate synthase pdxT subunit [Candidatus Hakubella thermalkaliphila]GFP42439.1 5'-phosphate synthase pdxT subunit [Candidatus H
MDRIKVGVLGLQGDVREHLLMVADCGAEGVVVKRQEDLKGIDGLIIPGGESTTMGRLMQKYDLIEPIQEMGREGVPIYGTCAGLILLAVKTVEGGQPLLELMDMVARRNAFGRQVDSFEADLQVKGIGDEVFHAIFIRAPWIEEIRDQVDPMAEVEGKIVMAREGNLLVSAFHPELSQDIRIHQFFIDMVRDHKKGSKK